ncbi:MAG: molecular chaperone [Rhizobiales bacterium]|nr:molecular chaperone [Hyphomicrobiales bacterium]MBI3672006.1 molecular chaperone [Hyphomicrobiales bacterium]
MRISVAGTVLVMQLLAAAGAASAASLQVAPVNIEVPAPGAATTLTLENLGATVVNAQIRIFRWQQTGGRDDLVATTDAVVSPPAVRMVAGQKSVIRIVRTTKQPIAGEEGYRLVVDEIPAALKPGINGVNFNVRYSIPVFFTTAGIAPEISWRAELS